MHTFFSWQRDLALGVRLAAGGGRRGWIRLGLTALGIGFAVGVLLIGASVPTIVAGQSARGMAQSASTVVLPGVDPLYFRNSALDDYRGVRLTGYWVSPSGPSSPKPPGVDKLPGAGEAVVSPALADLLASEAGAALRPRFPNGVIGVIADNGLKGPAEYRFYVGTPDHGTIDQGWNPVYSFGDIDAVHEVVPAVWLLAVVGLVALLFPVLVFVSTSTRLAGAARDRRLAALRLVGGSARQVRRIATGEALLGTVVGLFVGAVLFLLGRGFVEQIDLFGVSAFAADVLPVPALVGVIVVAVPALAVVSSLIAMRRTAVEPLGVVRLGRPARRRLWWRLVPVVIGLALLLSQGGASGAMRTDVLVAGVCTFLLGVPLLLPWLLERTVVHLVGGATSWQLAIRRMQLDSGTPARVVGGIAVVLAGGIALQSVIAGVGASVGAPMERAGLTGRSNVQLADVSVEDLEVWASRLRGLPAVRGVLPQTTLQVSDPGSGESTQLTIASCESLLARLPLGHCSDGDAFLVGSGWSPRPGQQVVVRSYSQSRSTAPWMLPISTASAVQIGSGTAAPQTPLFGVLATPGAFRGMTVPQGDMSIQVQLRDSDPASADQVANAVTALGWRAQVDDGGATTVSDQVRQFRTVRNAVLLGSGITLLLAGASLLVLAVEQVRERRRQLAVLAASGVPVRTLARSILWQNLVPVLIATAVAVLTGLVLGAFLLGVISRPVVFDWAGVVLLTSSAAALVLGVTAATLPTLRRASRPVELRAE
ncbi:ABC transporter permease [Kutzneria viridogrisea]|uniref:ABC-type lipoprotein release transport system permease subunit n=1 Tax=Kutzneria viridogrisea TaxID=47990 RepID=A0ABR6BXT7_9PSEU|nr:ABC-type lipoprotein release transport system permease subunit [Kutzneria viridogrisea]